MWFFCNFIHCVLRIREISWVNRTLLKYLFTAGVPPQGNKWHWCKVRAPLQLSLHLLWGEPSTLDLLSVFISSFNHPDHIGDELFLAGSMLQLPRTKRPPSYHKHKLKHKLFLDVFGLGGALLRSNFSKKTLSSSRAFPPSFHCSWIAFGTWILPDGFCSHKRRSLASTKA